MYKKIKVDKGHQRYKYTVSVLYMKTEHGTPVTQTYFVLSNTIEVVLDLIGKDVESNGGVGMCVINIYREDGAK